MIIFSNPPHLHQLLSTADALENPGYALGETMGGGKTRTALFCFLASTESDATVFAPKNAIPTWMDEISKIKEPLQVYVIGNQPISDLLAKSHHRVVRRNTMPDALEDGNQRSIVLVNKEFIRGRVSGRFPTGMLIVDEAHEENQFDQASTKLIVQETNTSYFDANRYLPLSGTLYQKYAARSCPSSCRDE